MCLASRTDLLATPAVSIDGVLKITGRIPKAEEVRGWFAAQG